MVYSLWISLAAVVGLVWLARCVLLGATLRKRVVLHDASYPGPPDRAPRVTIVVAAKDEEETIDGCVRTLLEQDYPDYELIVVDDRSRDRTAQKLREWERRAGGRLRVITIDELPDGWFGKSHAMHQAVRLGSGDWFLFTDADCTQTSTRTLSTALNEALTHHVDFLTITPMLDAPKVWERILHPVCSLVLLLWFLPERVNDPTKKTAYANGQFMLIHRPCYVGIGGHEAVRAHANEDIQLARRAKNGGFRLRVAENDGLYRTRMYRSPTEAWRGWSRIFRGCLETVPRLGLAMGLLSVFSLLPWISWFAAVAGWGLAEEAARLRWATAAWLWGLAVLFQMLVLIRLYPLFHLGRSWSALYPLGAAWTLVLLLDAAIRTARASSMSWRGTVYHRVGSSSVGIDRPISPVPPKSWEEPTPHE